MRIPLSRILLTLVVSGTAIGSAAETNAPGQVKAPPPKVWVDTTTRPTNWAVRIDRPGLPNFYRVTPQLYRGAQPTPQGMAELKTMGIRTIVNLRSFHSDDDELLGVDLKQGRLHMKPWHPEDEDLINFLKVVTNTNNTPVFVHCQRGSDRTGMVCALYRIVVCGWTKKAALQEMKEGGFGFSPLWNNLETHIERADIEDIKRRAGLIPPNTTPP
jgi:protein tyrosine/serine phosphatase